MSDQKEYAFDVTLKAAIRVKATDEKEARRILKESLDCADSNFGAWPNGDPITGEASLYGFPHLYEIDGENVESSMPKNETMLGEGERFHLFENKHGFRIVRLSDGKEVTYYGDDSCEELRDLFNGDEFPDNPADNKQETDELGEKLEERNEF